MTVATIRSSGGAVVMTLTSTTLTTAVLADLAELLADLARTTPSPLVLASAHPRIFLAGAHLAEIAALDATTSLAYAAAGRHSLAAIASFPAPVVAAVAGTCAGGGFDLLLACDAVVASPAVSVAHPGVRRGLVTGWGGTALVSAAFSTAAARRALLTGEPLAVAALRAAGWQVVDEVDPVPAATHEARRLAALHPARLKWHRSLKRGCFIDRFRTSVVHHQERY